MLPNSLVFRPEPRSDALHYYVPTILPTIDCNGEIAKEEARQFWGTNFAKVNAQAMFNEVDVDGNKLSRRSYAPDGDACGDASARRA